GRPSPCAQVGGDERRPKCAVRRRPIALIAIQALVAVLVVVASHAGASAQSTGPGMATDGSAASRGLVYAGLAADAPNGACRRRPTGCSTPVRRRREAPATSAS